MKKRLRCLALLLAALMALALPAGASSLGALMQEYGMTEAESQAFEALVAEMGATVSEEELRTLLDSLAGEDKSIGEPLPGTTENGVYTDPAGFSFPIPEGWTLQPSKIGGYITLAGQPDESGFTSTITILMVDQSADAPFLTLTQEEIDALLSASLKNYQPIALDDFEYLNGPAREMVCMYGANEDMMLMQYQLHFTHDEQSYVITMTTLAEEAAHDSALDIYDTFLASFSVQGGGMG